SATNVHHSGMMLPAVPPEIFPTFAVESSSTRPSRISEIARAAAAIAERPSSGCIPECAARPWNVTSSACEYGAPRMTTPVGGTVSRCAHRRSGSPSAVGSSLVYRFPIVEPTRGPASSSSTSSPQSRRYCVTASATARSSPGGLGSAASSQKRSTTSVGTEANLPSGVNLGAGARPLQRGGDELAEQRRGPRRTRLELGVELRGDEPRMVGQLDDLHQ